MKQRSHRVEKDSSVDVTFEEVAGLTSAKQDLREIVDFLRDPTDFQRLGGKVPRGVLLVGPPGTGKTLLARAVAGESGVPFFSMGDRSSSSCSWAWEPRACASSSRKQRK